MKYIVPNRKHPPPHHSEQKLGAIIHKAAGMSISKEITAQTKHPVFIATTAGQMLKPAVLVDNLLSKILWLFKGESA
jgi:hypothetical protein